MNIKEIENIYSELGLQKIISKFKKDNKIGYDYKLYEVFNNKNILIGFLIEYNIPIKNCLYFDIFVFKSDRRIGYGSSILELYKLNNKGKDIFIRSNQESKNNFLEKNGFKLIEDNLNKNLYYFDNK